MANKGKSDVSSSRTKMSRKEVVVGSSSREPTNLRPQKFGKQAVMHYGKVWYAHQQESKNLGNEYVDEERLHLEFPHIHAKINALGLQYFLVNQGEYNFSLVCEFYTNQNTHHVEINRGFNRDSGVRFSIEALNNFLGTPNFYMVEWPPYRDIRLCGVNFVAQWDVT